MLKVAWVGNICRHTGDVERTKRGDVTTDSMSVDAARSPSSEVTPQFSARFLSIENVNHRRTLMDLLLLILHMEETIWCSKS
jgi:hypothetical protein